MQSNLDRLIEIIAGDIIVRPEQDRPETVAVNAEGMLAFLMLALAYQTGTNEVESLIEKM